MKRLDFHTLAAHILILFVSGSLLYCGRSEEETRPTLSGFTFPFSGPAEASYTESPRSFGSCRDNCARRHAAADLLGFSGRSIHAVGDGTILDQHYFYDGTHALVIDHGSFVVRYGEISEQLPSGLSIGTRVKRGQIVAFVGDLSSQSANMLHFERFSGKGQGPLTVHSSLPYQRRSDLEDPTKDLLAWPYPR